MNLKENYKRFFGDLDQFDNLNRKVVKKQSKPTITEAQNTKFIRLNKYILTHFPNTKLSIKEGFVTVNGVVVDNITDFFNKDYNAQYHTVKKAIR